MTTPSPPTDESADEEGTATLRAGPFTARWDVTRAAETTFVTVHVTNAHPRERSVRIENRLDGVVRPPRRRGVAEPGWDTDGVGRDVSGGETVSFGYACHAPAVEPPIELREASRATPEPSSVERALRSLDDHAPPRAALPADADRSTPSERDDSPGSAAESETAAEYGPSETADEPGTADKSRTSETATSVAPADSPSREPDSNPGRRHTAEATTTAAAETMTATAGDRDPSVPDDASTPDADPSVPDVSAPDDVSLPLAVTAWFHAVDARLDTAARLDGPVAAATPLIASLGGRRGMRVLTTTLETDARALRAVAERATTLAARIEETDVPDVEVER